MKKSSLLAVAGFVIALGSTGGAEILEQVLVKVNGDIITKSDLERRQVAALRQRLNNQSLTEADLKTDEALKKALGEVTPRVLLEAIDELLLQQRGRELDLKMTDEQFKQILSNIRKQNNLDTDEKFQAALKQEGLSLEDLRKMFERQMIFQRLQQQEVFGKISVSEEESRAYYEAHKSEFTTPESVTLREILIARPVATKEQPNPVDNTAQRLAAVQTRLKAGEDFAKVAADASDAPSRANAGLIGPIASAELAGSLQEALAKMKDGEVSAPIDQDRGYQIIKLESRTATKLATFEDARDRASDKVFQSKQAVEFQKYLARLRSQAIIEWKNAEAKKAYEQALADAQKEQPEAKTTDAAK
jgi:peptidyl-prolyl cis-trans isomerase SurA